MTVRRLALAATLFAPAVAAPHTLQLAPSACAVEPFAIEAPRTGIRALVAPPAAADRTRILYTTGSNVIQFEAASASARAFALAASQGTVRLPTDFQATLTAAGDVTTHPLPLELELDGIATTLFVRFGTGLDGVGDAGGSVVVEGTPVAADGTLALVGVSPGGDGLPGAMRDPLVFRVTGRAAPPPDLDQYAAVPRADRLSGSVTPSGAKLRLSVRAADAAVPDFAASRAIARVSVGDATVATALVPTGLPATGRGRFASAPFAVKLGRRRPAPSFVVTLDVPTAALPAIAGPTATVGVALEAGGVLVRARREFRVSAGGTRLRAR